MSFPLIRAIDFDIHNAVPSTRDLTPNLGGYRREICALRRVDRMDPIGYPSIAPCPGRPDWRGGASIRTRSANCRAKKRRSFWCALRGLQSPARRVICAMRKQGGGQHVKDPCVAETCRVTVRDDHVVVETQFRVCARDLYCAMGTFSNQKEMNLWARA
jgi:hypothetical protein